MGNGAEARGKGRAGLTSEGSLRAVKELELASGVGVANTNAYLACGRE